MRRSQTMSAEQPSIILTNVAIPRSVACMNQRHTASDDISEEQRRMIGLGAGMSRSHEPSSSPRGSETVLLVEDEPTVRQLAARILRRQGYTVLEASDGAEALAFVERSGDLHIDLLFTDIVMPHMGGYALMEKLRQIRPEIKVQLTSGYTDSTTIIVNRLDYGIDFLGKPFTPSALARKVREVLDTQP